jgi:hypothetical protein
MEFIALDSASGIDAIDRNGSQCPIQSIAVRAAGGCPMQVRPRARQ